MKILAANPFEVLIFGFVIGFFIILISYLIAHFRGKEFNQIKKSLLIIGVILIFVGYVPPIKEMFGLWVVLSLLILSIIVNNIFQILQNLVTKFYDIHISPSKTRMITQIIYLSAALMAIGLVTLSSQRVIAFAYSIIKQFIFICSGVWLALRVLYFKKTED